MKYNFILPAIFGTLLEYYDYALYGFAAEMIARHFFPSTDDPSLALLKVYGVFIAGSCSKPLGSLLFGYLGDKYGRSFALKISMFGIALPTALVGCMPGYDVLGWWAAFFLLICRMLQGMFVSGESDGVRIFIYESLGKKRPCFANSISGMACMTGVYFASCAVSLAIGPQFPSYAWRIPFLIGGLLGVVVIMSRQYLRETPEFINFLKQRSLDPARKTHRFQDVYHSFKEVCLKNKQAILVTALLYGVVGGGYHFYFVFFGQYLHATLHILDAKQAALNTSNAILVYTLCAPLAGLVADRFGPLKALKTSVYVLLGMLALNAMMIAQGQCPSWLILLTAVNLSFFHTPGFVVLFQRFSVGERFRCVSMGHALGSMLLSGTAPFLSLWIWKTTQQSVAPLLYFMGLSILGYFALRLCESGIEREREAGLLVAKELSGH